jgi:hypothetical protein
VNNDNIRIAAASAVGALLGGVAGFLFLTERGRDARRQIEPAIDDLRRELMSLGKSLEGAGDVAREGWRLLQDFIAEGEMPKDDYSVTH